MSGSIRARPFNDFLTVVEVIIRNLAVLVAPESTNRLILPHRLACAPNVGRLASAYGPMDQRRFHIPSEINRLPADMGGLYMFSLRFPSTYELGISSWEEVSEGQAAAVWQLVQLHLKRANNLMASHSLAGEMVEQAKAQHLALSFSAQLQTNHSRRLLELINGLAPDLRVIREMSAIFRSIYDFLPPFYVGMTSSQSFSDRIGQHLSGQTQLSQRLAEHGVSWNEIVVSIVPVPGLASFELRTVEKLSQIVLRPPLSLS